MADDEDVIFDNSPLYRHLSEVGFTDFHVETLNNSDERAELIANGRLRQNNGENMSNRNLKERAINLAKRLILGIFLPSFVSEEISCYSSCVAMIKSSGLLAEDHLELLYRFEQCTETTFDTDSVVSSERKIKENNNKFTEVNNSILFNLVTSRFMLGVTLLTAIILGLLLDTNLPNLKIISYIFLSIVSIWLLLKLYSLRVKNRIYILKKKLGLLFECTQFTTKFLVLIRKVILFIQEKELIARGHIIVNPAAPVTRLESQIKQCMILRKCLFVEMNSYLDLLRNKIKDVSNSRFNTDYGNLSWLLKELSKIENECLIESEKNLQANGYSLMTLKKTFATLVSRQSSLLFCTAVNLMLAIIYLKQPGRKQDKSFEFYSCLGDLLEQGKKLFDNVNKCYKFHKVDIPARIFDENHGHVPCDKTVYASFTMALRSMTLHLQQACKTSIGIEEKLDNLVSESIEDPVCNDLDEINKQILYIGQGVEKINVCWQESQSRLEEITFSSSEKQTNIAEEKANVNPIEQEDRNVQIFNLTEEAEPVPDQIFEGETTSECENEKQNPSPLGKEELLREEKMREESRHLLKELKSVLATKDEEKMVGIPRVLLLKRFGAVGDEGHVGNTVESEEIDVLDKVSSPVMESQSEVKGKSSMDETESVKLYVNDTTVKEQAFNMIPVVTNPPKNVEQSIPGRDNAGTEIDGNHVVYNPINACSTDHQPFIGQMSHANPFASMVAAAAAARNRQFGVTEQSYEIEAETCSDDSDTD